MISEDEALQLIENTSKCKHAQLVAAMMEKLASELGESEQKWRLVGLLHDLDYDETKRNVSRHGILAAERLEGRLPQDCIYAIKAHDYRSQFKPKSTLGMALVAVDSLAVLMEKKSIEIEESSVARLRAELTNISISEPWCRINVMKCKKMGLSLDEFLEACSGALEKKKI